MATLSKTRQVVSAFNCSLLMIRSHSFLLLEKFKDWSTESLPRPAFDDFLYVLAPE